MTSGEQNTKSLFTRYMEAFHASEAHTVVCPPCQGETPCKVGVPLHERFARLQDAYLARQRQQR
ncbi:hypothetical protein ACFY2H_36090 [Streptomyces griseofuscus]|uniref:hypothetical protein n=1 Tax=Streptomyces griseofuscus TaxID=146922 RepID=UPI0036A0A832